MEHSTGAELLDEVLLNPRGDAFLLDVRNPVEAQRWRPNGPGLRGYANVPYYEFIEDEDAAAARVPAGAQTYVLCAKGGSSAYVADVLREHGIDATNIAGGMIAWAAYQRFVRANPPGEPFAIYQSVRPAKGCLSYVIASAGEALIVDASRNADAYENFLTRQNVRIAATLDTHLHADHISGGAALAARGGVPYYLAREDADGAAIAREDMPRTLRVGDVPVEIVTLPVPGHTLGSTAVLIANRYLLSGDTLLPEGVGRPDLGNKAGEWSGFLYDSLHDVVAHLNDHTLVLPAHAASSDDYDARGRCMRPLNELLRAANISDRSAFLDRVQQTVAQSTQPPEYAEIRRVNLGTPVSAEKAEELEVGMNRCALAAGGD